MTDREIKNARILEAFSLIDEKYIGEVATSLKLDDYSEEPPKPSPWKSLKPVLALVACALLIGALFPVVSYLISLGGFNPGENPAGIGEESNSRVIKTGYQVYGGEVYNERIGRLVRYLPATDEYESLCDHKTCPEGCHFRSIECLSQIVDGKLYYIYDSVWGLDQDIRVAYLDLSTMESVDIGDISAYSITGRAYVYDGYYYFSRKINLPRNRTELYRIPIAGGSEELVLEFDGEGSLFMVADGEIITTNRYDYLLDPPPLVIKAYNIETGAERVLWSRDDGEDIRVLEPAFLDGKLYFLASADEGNDLIRVDLESGEEECVQSGLSDRYWLMNDGVYYFRFEVRTINYRSPISSLIGDDRVADSASLYYYGFDEKKETVVYKNEDIAPCYPSGMVIAGTKVCGYFCGNFPALGLERAEVLISIDLSTGEIKALDEAYLPRFPDVTVENTEAETTEEIDIPEPPIDAETASPVEPLPTPHECHVPYSNEGIDCSDRDMIEHIGEVPDVFVGIISQNLFADSHSTGDRVFVMSEGAMGSAVTVYDKFGNLIADITLEKPIRTYRIHELSDGTYLAIKAYEAHYTWSDGKSQQVVEKAAVVKFTGDGKILFETEFDIRSDLGFVAEVSDGYIISGGLQNWNDITEKTRYVYKLDKSGNIIKTRTFPDNSGDMILKIAYESDGLVLYQQKRNGSKNEYFKICLKDDLSNKSTTSIASPPESPKIYSSPMNNYYAYWNAQDFFGGLFEGGRISSVIYYDDFILFVSENDTKYFPYNDPASSTLLFYSESVYSAYTYDGELIWRCARDSTDYELFAELEEKYKR